MFLVYFLTTSLTTQLSAHATQIEGMRQLLQQHMSETELQRQESKFFLRQLCINTAHTDDQRLVCQEK